VTMSQGVVYDSPSPANAAFTAGTGGSITIRAHGIPAPSLSVDEVFLTGCSLNNFDNHTQPGVSTLQLTCNNTVPVTSSTFNLIVSNNASSITVPFKLNVETSVHITSPTAFTLTYGVPVDFVMTATGSSLRWSIPSAPWPDGINFADDGHGTMHITGTPMASNRVLACLVIGGA